ncbi:MAG: DUF4330 domain-containing protein [Oscillospiraceae bacterium]|jgi:hypothetical protein|nr:DUF4330 domain-containing protein [Oscillospiraceae bacterium]
MKKIIDENGRLFGKISVLDLVVIAVIIALAAAAYTKFNVLETTATTTKTVPTRYTVLVKNSRQTTADMLRAGDKFFTENGLAAGTVAAVDVAPATVVSPVLDGTYAVGTIEGRVDITLTLDAQCSVTNGRYYVERTVELNVNNEQKYRTKYADFSGTILSITPVGDTDNG